MPENYETECGAVVDWGYSAGKTSSDPFNELTLDALITGADGSQARLPAFWNGGSEWRFRFSAGQPGVYAFRTVCSDPSDSALHDQSGVITVGPYTGDNPLLRHGALRVGSERNCLEHQDGTPFFWLGDTWWMAFVKRLKWPDDFKNLTDDRSAKGFTVIQLVAGLYPDMQPFDPRGANEGGWAWEEDFARINPGFFEQADRKLAWLVRSGLTPVMVGAWGYYLAMMGVDKMKQHWRYLVARYGAYPLLWCLAGETLLAGYDFHLSKEEAQRRADWQKQGWSEVARYLREIDPYRRLLTTHPTSFSHSERELLDPSLLDFDMIQTGHGNLYIAVAAARCVAEISAQTTVRPVVNAETCYEGVLGVAWQDVQRFIFWSSMLSGAYGYTYGANGIWQVNETDQPYGASPHKMSWGSLPWKEASQLPGSTQLALGKRLLAAYPWQRCRPHPEWVSPSAGDKGYFEPYAAGIPGELRLVYFPEPLFPWEPNPPEIRELEPGVGYTAFFFNTISGERIPVGRVEGDAQGRWRVAQPPIGQDLVLVLEKEA